MNGRQEHGHTVIFTQYHAHSRGGSVGSSNAHPMVDEKGSGWQTAISP